MRKLFVLAIVAATLAVAPAASAGGTGWITLAPGDSAGWLSGGTFQATTVLRVTTWVDGRRVRGAEPLVPCGIIWSTRRLLSWAAPDVCGAATWQLRGTVKNRSDERIRVKVRWRVPFTQTTPIP